MTHDDLVRFAAEKLVVEIRFWNGRWLMPLSFAKSWVEIEGNLYENFNLTSFELFGKGLAVCEHEVNIFKGQAHRVSPVKNEVEIWRPKDDRLTKKAFNDVTELPLAFWTVWYELERETDG